MKQLIPEPLRNLLICNSPIKVVWEFLSESKPLWNSFNLKLGMSIDLQAIVKDVARGSPALDIRITPAPPKFALKVVAEHYLRLRYPNLGNSGFADGPLTVQQISYAAMNATVLVWLLRYLATAKWLLWKDGFLLDNKVSKLVLSLGENFRCPDCRTDIGPTSGYFFPTDDLKWVRQWEQGLCFDHNMFA